MKRMHNKRKKYVFSVHLGTHKHYSITRLYKSVFAIAILAFTSATLALLQVPQTAGKSTYECTQVALNDIDETLLTKEERIALFDESLTTSIDSYSTCVGSAVQTMSEGGTTGQGAAGSSAGGNLGNGDDGQASVNTPTQTTINADVEQTQNVDTITPSNSNQVYGDATGKGTTSSPRGIIAPTNNDKIICKLLYQEITNTQDADMLKGLKQQYSNYKCGQ